MTQRAFEREQYKRKKRMPAPEVPKPKNHHKGEKVWFLQYRYTQEAWEKMLAEDKRREKESVGKRWIPWFWTVGKNNEWTKEGKYYDREAAEVVMKHNLRLQKEGRYRLWEYEYRIVHKDELEREKDEKLQNSNKEGK